MDERSWPLVQKLCQFECERKYISFQVSMLQRHVSRIRNCLLALDPEDQDSKWLVKILRRTSRSLKSFSEESGLGSTLNPPSKSTEVSGRVKNLSCSGHDLTHES